MKTLTASKITAKELKKGTVMVKIVIITRGIVADCCLVSKTKDGYKVGYKCAKTGTIKLVKRFKTLAEAKAVVTHQ